MAINLPQQPTKNAKTEKTAMSKINDYLKRFGRVPLKEKLFFVQHLSVMVKAGISLSAALKTLTKQTENKYFASILEEISSNVEKGTSFAECLKPHNKIFGELFVNMIEAGEISGKLEEVLQQLYIQMKKQNELISKVKGALTYPIVILVAMLGIGIFMIVFIVPKITGIFQELNAELPLPTKILIGVSNALVNHGIIAGLLAATFIISFLKVINTHKGKYYFQTILLELPIISPIIKKINLARFSRTVSGLLKTDIMIIKTFQITANVLSNLHYKEALLEMSEKIKKGSQINEVVAKYSKLFPPIVYQMIAVGEETGELDNILVELAEFYENEIDQIMSNLPSIIEPILILFLGCGVGAMAVAIIMPMYSLSSTI